jgi:RNA polymerase sigma factor (sigma-70 family)
MATRTSEVVQHLLRAVVRQGEAGLTDGQLLGRFLEQRDEAAVAALVQRHGPMVWGVCRRVLGSHHDAEDAFQATFLVLARKAASVVPREMVGNWLYGVAHQTAMKARAMRARRRTRERQVTKMPEPEAPQRDVWADLQPVMDRELSRLADKYRVAIVLCYLEGKTRKEAARQLGCPEGTLAGRLARGRALLAKRLARRGVALSGGTLSAVLSESATSASLPTSVMFSTIKAVTSVAAGQAAGLVSTKAAALLEGVQQLWVSEQRKRGLCCVRDSSTFSP